MSFELAPLGDRGGKKPATKRKAAPHVERTLAELKRFAGGDTVVAGRASEIEVQHWPQTKIPKR